GSAPRRRPRRAWKAYQKTSPWKGPLTLEVAGRPGRCPNSGEVASVPHSAPGRPSEAPGARADAPGGPQAGEGWSPRAKSRQRAPCAPWRPSRVSWTTGGLTPPPEGLTGARGAGGGAWGPEGHRAARPEGATATRPAAESPRRPPALPAPHGGRTGRQDSGGGGRPL